MRGGAQGPPVRGWRSDNAEGVAAISRGAQHERAKNGGTEITPENDLERPPEVRENKQREPGFSVVLTPRVTRGLRGSPAGATEQGRRQQQGDGRPTRRERRRQEDEREACDTKGQDRMDPGVSETRAEEAADNAPAEETPAEETLSDNALLDYEQESESDHAEGKEAAQERGTGTAGAATEAQEGGKEQTPAAETQGSKGKQQDAQRPEGEAGVRRGRNAMEGSEGEHDTPPPKPTARVTSSTQGANDMSMAEAPMAEAPTPAVGAPGTGAKSYAKAARRGAGSVSAAGASSSKTAQQLKQGRLEWLGRGKAQAAPAGETTPKMAPSGEPQGTEASSDSAQDGPSSPEVAEATDWKRLETLNRGLL